MAASAGAVGIGGIMAVLGTVLLIAGIGMFMSGPLVTTSYQQNSGLFGIGGSQSASGSVNLVPILGLVLVVVGAVVLIVGLKGTMRAFEKGKERDEGTKQRIIHEQR
ncbi:MAG: hypothetical protein LC624_02345 [Halobacteriales archaeon]|nr:hypothetical protein [Halobacteriales archaeon]